MLTNSILPTGGKRVLFQLSLSGRLYDAMRKVLKAVRILDLLIDNRSFTVLRLIWQISVSVQIQFLKSCHFESIIVGQNFFPPETPPKRSQIDIPSDYYLK